MNDLIILYLNCNYYYRFVIINTIFNSNTNKYLNE